MKPGRHWLVERILALALVPLSAWFIVGMLGHITASRDEIVLWLAEPFVSAAMGLFIIGNLLHTKMGITVIIDDYVHTKNPRCTLMLVKDLCVFVLIGITLCALYKIHGGH